MQFTINKNQILNVLSKIQGLTGRKSNLAITENCLIKTDGSNIKIMATDLETGFEGSYPAKIEREGNITLNAKKFYEIVKDFPVDEIVVNEIESRWIEIGNQNVQYHVIGMNPDDFPDNPYIDEATYFEMNAYAFKKMIEKTSIISGPSDDKRAHINGIYFERIRNEDVKMIRMVSTDGSRLSKIDYRYDKDFDLPVGAGILIPKKGLSEANKFLSSEGVMHIGLKENYFIIKQGSETVIIRLLEGNFPDYKGIIAKGKISAINLDRQSFLMMLKRMSILSSESYRGVIFNFGDHKLVVNSVNPDIGEAKEEMNIEYGGNPIEVAFNPKYFIDTLNVIEGERVVVHIIDEEKPCLIEEENNKDFLSVIMPMRI
jgi:DNA polymerase-3 subunit beta